MRKPTPVTGVVIMLAVWTGLALFAVWEVMTLPVPPQWFDAWSKLIATIAVAAIGARVLWSVPAQLQEFLDRTLSARERSPR